MSDHQFRALQELLANSAVEKSNNDLDREILTAARSECELNKRSEPHLKLLFTPLGATGNAMASAAITGLVFLAMALLVSVPEPDVVYADSAYVEVAYQPKIKANLTESLAKPSRQQGSIQRPYVVEYSADELLLELSLPSVTDLIESMEFVAENERSAATIELISALADINALIGVGELDNARQRYLDLRARCYTCELPRTLEALALNSIRDHGSG